MPDKLQASLGQPVVVENRPGAALMLAAAIRREGRTGWLHAAGFDLIGDGHQSGSLQEGELRPREGLRAGLLLCEIADDPCHQSELPAKSVPELIKLAKDSKTPLTYSSPGAGVAQHLSMEYMKKRFGLEITHVPYKSTPQSIADIAAGHVNLGFAEAGASLPLIRDGKLRPLAVSATTRLPSLPDVPPFAEAASAPDFEAVSWHMLFAPAATPKPIVDRLHAEMKKIMADPEMIKLTERIGLIPVDTPSVDGIQSYMASSATNGARW